MFIYLIHILIIALSLYLHLHLSQLMGFPLFSVNIFLLGFTLVFLLRFIRFTLRHFYFLSFCPVVALFFSYLNPVSGATAAFLAIFLFEILLLKKSVKDPFYSALVYFSGASFITLIKYLPLSSNLILFLFFIIGALLYPLFFYLPLIIKSKDNLKEHLYILFWEHAFLFFYLVLTFLFYESFLQANYLRVTFLLIFFLISVAALKDSLKVDKLSLLHKIENYLAGSFSLESSLNKIFRFLKAHLSFEHMKVFVQREGEITCIFSDEDSYKNKKFAQEDFKDIINKNRVYVKHLKDKKTFLSPKTLSFYATSLKTEGDIQGFIVFESKNMDNFSEDDIERLNSVCDLISRIIGSYLTIQNLPKVSEDLKVNTVKIKEFMEGTLSFLNRIDLSFKELSRVFTGISEKLHKNFEVLENLASNFEGGSQDLRKYSEIFKEKRLKLSEMLFPLKEAEESMAELKKSFSKLKENILKSISLNERMQGFVEFMKDYASKTRLLSLNAAIEATRLGEEARGFSIIAEEIGNLAQSVENVITKLTEEFESSVSILEETKSLLDEYDKLLEIKRNKFLPSSE